MNSNKRDMEKKDTFIQSALQREVDYSKSELSEALLFQLKRIGKTTSTVSVKQFVWMAASMALLISLNCSIFFTTTQNKSETEQVYSSYFSHINTSIE